jgi:hypothetical protein
MRREPLIMRPTAPFSSLARKMIPPEKKVPEIDYSAKVKIFVPEIYSDIGQISWYDFRISDKYPEYRANILVQFSNIGQISWYDFRISGKHPGTISAN